MILNIFLLGMPGIGSWVIIALALLLFFGGKKIPELMKGRSEERRVGKEWRSRWSPEH